MIDSRDFIAAKRRAEAEVLVPPGPKVAFTGGLDYNDHRAIWDRLEDIANRRHGRDFERCCGADACIVDECVDRSRSLDGLIDALRIGDI